MQIRNILSGACGFALLATAGIAYASTASKTVSNTDRQFMITAARADMTEAHEGQMAENQATQADVKTFAKTLVDDHTSAYAELSELAAKLNVTIPKGIDVAKNQTIVQLVHAKGARFDSQFARDEVAAHKSAIAVFKREAAHGQDTDVKAYAAKMVPVLEKHLHAAEGLAKPSGRS